MLGLFDPESKGRWLATDEAIPLRADIEWANTTLVFHPVGLAPPVPLAPDRQPAGCIRQGVGQVSLEPVRQARDWRNLAGGFRAGFQNRDRATSTPTRQEPYADKRRFHSSQPDSIP
jgi:hypothetical protein